MYSYIIYFLAALKSLTDQQPANHSSSDLFLSLKLNALLRKQCTLHAFGVCLQFFPIITNRDCEPNGNVIRFPINFCLINDAWHAHFLSRILNAPSRQKTTHKYEIHTKTTLFDIRSIFVQIDKKYIFGKNYFFTTKDVSKQTKHSNHAKHNLSKDEHQNFNLYPNHHTCPMHNAHACLLLLY